MGMRCSGIVGRGLLLAGVMVFVAAPSRAALVAYYTLNNADAATTAGSGLKNLGTTGANSDMSVATFVATSTPTLATGFIGNPTAGTGALSFDGVDDGIGTFGKTSDAVDGRNSYPYTMSIWINVTSSSGGAPMGITALASSDRYSYLGNSNGKASINRRNTTAIATASPNAIVDQWQQVLGVFQDNTNALLYVNGKLVATQTTSVTALSPNLLTIGNVYRSNTNAVAAFKGLADDAGFFDTALSAADAALVNGLGRTGAIGLDQFGAAQTLNGASVGTTASIGGVTWKRVTGLTGTTGDWGGSVAGANAYIVTSASGDGITVVPEPASFGILAAGGMLLGRRRRRV